MRKKRILIGIATLVVTAGLALVLPMTAASAAACNAPAWNATAAYTGGTVVVYNGRQYTANWWTQGHRPDQYSGQWQEWRDDGACTGGGGSTTAPPPPPPPPGTTAPPPGGGTCSYPVWAEGRTYTVGTRVSYSGAAYEAIVTHTAHVGANWNPAASPTLWRRLSTCGGTQPPPPPPTTTTNPPPPPSGGFVVTEAQFNQMFPGRNPFYTYVGLTTAMNSFPAFARTGTDTVRRQEAAAFLANVHHETGGLVHIVEQNTANYPHYCDASQPYGCPAGQAAYYGRGPIQLSWNFNYKAAGDALGMNLLGDPYRVEREAAVAWATGLWYWMTQNGPGTMTAHNAMVNGAGFGQTIRSINGSIECNGGNPAQVQSRVSRYQQFTQILGVPAGSNLTC